jgi:hypothetical protein
MPLPENPNLQQVLDNPELLSAFQNYSATRIFDPKPVPFLLAVQQFKKAALDPQTSVQQLSEMASQIATEYVKPDGYVQAGSGIGSDGIDFLNIPSTMSQETNANVERLNQMARGEIPLDRQNLASTFDAADEEMRMTVGLKDNNLDQWKKSSQFGLDMEKANAAIKPAEDRIKQLESRAETLQTSRWERFKAVFRGGAKKELAEINQKIDQAKMEILQRTDPKKFETIQSEKQKMAERLGEKQTRLAPNIETLKDASIRLGLENLGMTTGMSQQERTGLEKIVAKNEASERLGQQKEELTKSVSVGEALKGKVGNTPAQGQRGPHI